MEHSDSPLRTPLPMPARIGSAVIALLLSTLLSTLSFSQTITSEVTGGNWHSTSTWVGGVVPTLTNDVVIATGSTVTVSNALPASCANITVDGTLNVDNLGSATTPLSCTSMTINGIVGIDVGNATGKTVAIQGSIFITSTGTVNHSSGKLHVYDWIQNGSYSSSTGATVEIPANTSAAKSICGTAVSKNFKKLTVSMGGTITALCDFEVTEMLNIESGTTLDMGSYTLYGITDATNNTMGSGVLRTSNSSSTPIPAGGGTTKMYNFAVNYAGANQTVVSVNYKELTISGSGVKTISENIAVSNQLNLSTTGYLSIATNKTLTLGTAAFIPGILNHTSGYIQGGFFKRWLDGSLFTFGDARGFFPMGDANGNLRYFYLDTYSSDIDQWGGGTLRVKHFPNTGFTAISPPFMDSGLEINNRHNMYWNLYSSDLTASGLKIRLQASGIDGLWSISALRLTHSTTIAGGSHGGTSGTISEPLVDRNGLEVDLPMAAGYLNSLNGNFYIGTNVASNPLPVELTSFSARLRKDVVNLNWATATELNNFGFEIYRSNSGSTTEDEAWTLVGFVNGHGTSLSPKQYSFDDVVGATSGSIFYRLKQIDRDGTAEYSKVVSVNPGRTSFALSQNYPNPFSGATAINYSLESDEQVTLQVYDIMGNLVSTIVEEPQTAGNYVATFDPGSLNLKPGNYILRLTAGNFVENRKMVYVP